MNECSHNRKICLLHHDLSHPTETEPEYLVFVPENYEPRYAYPLLIWFHHAGSDEEQLERIMPFVSARNYLAIAPRGMAMRWDDGSVGYGWPQNPQGLGYAQYVVATALEKVAAKYHFSPRRIFVAGFADGGSMAVRLALTSPAQFAGAATLGGPIPTWGRPFVWLRSQRQLSFLFMLGAQSVVFSPVEACRALRLFYEAGLSVVLRQYPCGDQIHHAMLADLNRWIMGEITGRRPFLADGDSPAKFLQDRSGTSRADGGFLSDRRFYSG